MVQLRGRSDVLLRRPMSVYDVATVRSRAGARGRSRSPDLLLILYKVVGRGTRLMAGLRPGDKVGLLGPLGRGFFDKAYRARVEQAQEVLLVAGGVGIAALLLPARALAELGIPSRLFFGARTASELVGLDNFRTVVPHMVLATEDGSRGHHGLVTQPLEAYLREHSNERLLLMACGPWAMLRTTADLAKRHGYPCLVSLENRMGCGLGACLGCSVRVEGEGHEAYQRVCTEGPVFWAETIVWD